MSDTHEHVAAALAGRYAIGRELGRGGMATVFAARDEATGHEVAVKVLHRDLTVALGPARFKREIEIASSLDHPHILPVLDSGVAAGSLYLVMPLVTGDSLHDRLVRERQLSIDEAVRLTAEVASALAYAHERGVVHRDIKPENILLQDGRALVADFGIARATGAGDRLTQTGLSLGTPTYMSPEQAAAERDLDGRSDQYSLGCMLYEMLAGGPPYSAPTAQGLMARHALDAIPSISIVRSTVPDQVEDALYRALAKSPADRFPNVADFAAALGDPSRWITTPRQRGDRRAVPRGTADRRRSRVRRALYSVALTVPMATAGLVGWRYWVRPVEVRAATTADAAAAARRIAVLYFDDLSDGGELAPVADGLTEALIEALGQVSQLDVVSKNGVLPFRGAAVQPDSVAQALKVGTIVRGGVERERDGSVRLTVRLVDASSGADLERATFRQPPAGVLALRDSLATSVAEFLRARIGEEVRLRQRKAGTSSVEAWTSLQRAERIHTRADSLWSRGDTAVATRDLVTADSLLAAAEALDARWTELPVRRGAIMLTRAKMIRRKAPLAAARLIEDGLGHANRALALNPADAAALELRGGLRFERLSAGLATDPAEAKETIRVVEQDLRAALKLDTHRATAWVTLSEAAYLKKDVADANLAARRAYEEDAYLGSADDVVWRLFATSYDLENAVDATQWCGEGARRFTGDIRFHRCQLLLMILPGAQPDVPHAWDVAAKLEQDAPAPIRAYEARRARLLVAGALGRAGLVDSARRVLAASPADRSIDPRGELIGFEAMIRSLMGDRDEAFALLKNYLSAYPEHRSGFAKRDYWWWRDLKSDPRYAELVSTGR